MRLTMKLTVAFLFVACLAGLLWEEPVRAGRVIRQPNIDTVRARAIVSGPKGIQGEVLFYKGLAPGVRRPPQEHQQSTTVAPSRG